jgi:REP element-mobilizing transposase RayT
VRPKQPFLPGFKFSNVTAHGGESAHGKRKTMRPLDPKQAVHLILKSSRALGPHSMLSPRHCNRIETLAHNLAKKWGIRIYRYANVGNHLHFLVKSRTRRAWRAFLRELSGSIAILVTGARKGQAEKFWDQLAFTRIVKFGRDFNGVALYLIGNIFEAMGVPLKKLKAQGYRLVTIGPDG